MFSYGECHCQPMINRSLLQFAKKKKLFQSIMLLFRFVIYRRAFFGLTQQDFQIYFFFNVMMKLYISLYEEEKKRFTARYNESIL